MGIHSTRRSLSITLGLLNTPPKRRQLRNQLLPSSHLKTMHPNLLSCHSGRTPPCPSTPSHPNTLSHLSIPPLPSIPLLQSSLPSIPSRLPTRSHCSHPTPSLNRSSPTHPSREPGVTWTSAPWLRSWAPLLGVRHRLQKMELVAKIN